MRKFWRNRFAPWWRDNRWFVIAAAGGVAFVLGLQGYARQAALFGDSYTWRDLVYKTIQLFVFGSCPVEPPLPWQLETARFLAPAVALYTAIEAAVALFDEQVQSSRMRFLTNHVLVCGLGEKGALLAKCLAEGGHRVAAVDTDAGNPSVGECRERGIPVIIGDATDPMTQRKVRIARARHVVATCGQDGTNAAIAVTAHAQVSGRSGRTLTAHVHVVDAELCSLMKEREIEATGTEGCRMEFFNVYERGARALFSRYPLETAAPGSGGQTHLLVVGLGRFGRSVVVQAARDWRARRGESGVRLRVSVVDRGAREKVQLLALRYPRIGEVCELVPLQMATESVAFAEARFLFDPDGDVGVSAVYTCFDDDSRCLATALALFQKLRGTDVPIVVRMNSESGLATLLARDEQGSDRFENLRAFGLLDQACTPELLLGGTHEILGRAIHEEYLRAREAAGDTKATNPSLVPWETLPERLRESSRRQADSIGQKLTRVGCELVPLADWDVDPAPFTPAEVELMAEMEHERWMGELQADGWQLAPGAKSAARKTHPDLVPWERLPEPERDIDRCFVRGLPSFLVRAGFQIARTGGRSTARS